MTKSALWYVIFVAALTESNIQGQDLHFSGTQNMNIWYNPALKTNKVPQAHINFRNVNYPNLITYNSKAATIELPLISREKEDEENIFFMNVAAGISTDNATNKFMNASTAMLSLSYALPLNNNYTYLALGFQGCYTFNRVGLGTTSLFDEKFDRYGALSASLKTDPLESGLNYGFLTLGTGATLFHNGEASQWYFGGSIRHFNHPYTEWTKFVQMPSNYGLQYGFKTKINPVAGIGAFGNLMWHGDIHERIVGGSYTRYLNDSTSNAVTLGTAYRFDDAILPNLTVTIGRNELAFFYDISIRRYQYVRRRAYEFTYSVSL